LSDPCTSPIDLRLPASAPCRTASRRLKTKPGAPLFHGRNAGQSSRGQGVPQAFAGVLYRRNRAAGRSTSGFQGMLDRWRGLWPGLCGQSIRRGRGCVFRCSQVSVPCARCQHGGRRRMGRPAHGGAGGADGAVRRHRGVRAMREQAIRPALAMLQGTCVAIRRLGRWHYASFLHSS